MRHFAQSTSVSVEKSKAEIERLLTRYGADKFASGWTEGKAMIAFTMSDRHIRFYLPLSDKNAEVFWKNPKRKKLRKPEKAFSLWEQSCRQKWRALALVIKAKLEAVASDITSFEDEFMAHIVLPGGKTVGEIVHPEIEAAYKTNKVPQLLPRFG